MSYSIKALCPNQMTKLWAEKRILWRYPHTVETTTMYSTLQKSLGCFAITVDALIHQFWVKGVPFVSLQNTNAWSAWAGIHHCKLSVLNRPCIMTRVILTSADRCSPKRQPPPQCKCFQEWVWTMRWCIAKKRRRGRRWTCYNVTVTSRVGREWES